MEFGRTRIQGERPICITEPNVSVGCGMLSGTGPETGGDDVIRVDANGSVNSSDIIGSVGAGDM